MGLPKLVTQYGMTGEKVTMEAQAVALEAVQVVAVGLAAAGVVAAGVVAQATDKLSSDMKMIRQGSQVLLVIPA